MKELSRETFAACGAPEFRVDPAQVEDADAPTLSLTECVPLPHGGREEGREPFSLLFTGPPEPVLPQRIYRLENDELGPLEIFLVPVASDDRGTRYEAVFS